jgi:riboflavin transporter FmnP
MCIAIPPKHPMASVIGFLKGKSVTQLRTDTEAGRGIAASRLAGASSIVIFTLKRSQQEMILDSACLGVFGTAVSSGVMLLRRYAFIVPPIYTAPRVDFAKVDVTFRVSRDAVDV